MGKFLERISNLIKESQRSPFDDAMFVSDLTPRAMQVFALARKEADRLHHTIVRPEHLLLGLLTLGQGVALNVFKHLEIDLEMVRACAEKENLHPAQHSSTG